jgi:acetyl-CoA synthetase
VAWHLPDHLGAARPVREDVLRAVLHDKNSTDWHDWPYLAGDGAVQAADGYFRILGRIDDVINVAGHRLGTKELESATITVDEVAEAAAVPVIDELRGRAVEMYVALKPGTQASPDIVDKVTKAIEPRSGRSRVPRMSGSSPTCRRPGRARSCAG